MGRHGRHAAAPLAILAAVVLAGCAESTAPSRATTSPGSNTPTVTVTVTQTLPAPTLTRPKAPPTSPMTPPPAKDPLVIPGTARDYAEAFVRAWVERNRAHLEQLGTASAVTTATGSTVDRAPTFRSCEGAAGSTYCTWEGVEYTMTVRVLTEKASLRQMHAVTEVRFAH